MIAAHFGLLSPPPAMKRSLRSRRWAPSIATVAAFAALGATCAYWALQLLAPPMAIAPAASLVDTRSAPDLSAAQALFGRASADARATAPAGIDVRVLGVAANPARGSAVLVVDSGAARAYRVGETLVRELRLVEVRADAVALENAGERIELAAPPRPSIALLSSGPEDGDPAQPAKAGTTGTADEARVAAAHAPAAAPVPGVDPLSPRGGGVIDPSRFSGQRAGSVRPLAAPAGSDGSAAR